jgi:hypothetical protein
MERRIEIVENAIENKRQLGSAREIRACRDHEDQLRHARRARALGVLPKANKIIDTQLGQLRNFIRDEDMGQIYIKSFPE